MCQYLNKFTLASTRAIDGTLSLPAEDVFQLRITSILLKSQLNHPFFPIDLPSSMSSKLNNPQLSLMIGRVYGSQPAILIPGSTLFHL